MKKMTWKDIRCSHISRRHDTCNQCLSSHILVLKLVIILHVFLCVQMTIFLIYYKNMLNNLI
jgi:hypothetical protein